MDDRPAGGSARCRSLFASTGDGMDAGGEATQERLPEVLSKSPPATHELVGRSPSSVEEGRFLLVTSLTPGILPFALRASFAV